MATHTLTVTPEESNLRIDVYLTQSVPDLHSRSFVQKLIEAGHVQVNRATVKSNYKIRSRDRIDVDVPQDFLFPENIKPEDIKLDIIYEDKSILVINKPSGMVVHPASGHFTGTLVNALLHYTSELSDLNSQMRPGIVHRLDQETSGIILVAKNNSAHAKLSEQFQNHEVKKKYVALVEGDVQFDEGEINEPIGRHPLNREKQTVSYDEGSREAITFYRVIKRTKSATYIALFPKTGRTHQLRVHMAYIRHPILGDEKYGRKSTFPRLALHAQSIGFVHPRTKKFVEFSTTPPKEFLEKVGLRAEGKDTAGKEN